MASNKDYAEIICQAVDEIVSKKIEGINFDKTINCIIVDDKEAQQGRYKVSDGSAKFYAYSNTTDYKIDDAVYVTVPNGDYDNQKIIIGKQVSNNTSPFIFTTPFDTIVDVSSNLIDKQIDLKNCYLLANNPDRREILIWSKNFKDSMQDIAGFTRLGIQGQFRSWLDSFKCVDGDYGYKIILKCDEDLLRSEQNNYDKAIEKIREDGVNNDSMKFVSNTTNIVVNWSDYYDSDTKLYDQSAIIEYLQSEQKKLNFKQYELFLSSKQDMYGNPYNFESFYQQEKVFDISNIKQIESIELYFYQEINSFLNKDNKMIPYLDDFGNLLMPNLFTKDPYICLGYDIADFDNDQATIYCLDSYTYSNNFLLDNNRKHIILRWIHQFDDGRTRTVSNKTTLEYEIRWYRYKLGVPSADEYSGVYWQRLGGKDFQLTLEPDLAKESEMIKAIILFNGKVIRSNILTFTNEKEVINSATTDFLSGLNIWCKDQTYGNYFIYDPGNKILEQYDVKQAHELVALFSTKANLMNSESDGSILTEATSITWTFPTVNTMLTVYNIDYSYPIYKNGSEQIKYSICRPRSGIDTENIEEENGLPIATFNLKDGTKIVYDGINKTLEITRYGDINNGNSIDASQLYFIKDTYIQSYTNNVVQCSIIKDQQEYFTSKNFNFGQSGTTGTDVTLRLYIDPVDTFALTKQKGGDSIKIRAILYDSQNREIDPNNETNNTKMKYTWSWYSFYNNQDIHANIVPAVGSSSSGTINTIESNQIIINKQFIDGKIQDKIALRYSNAARNEIYIEATENLDMNDFLILQCKIDGWGDYPLISYKPIAIRNGSTYSFIDCADEVIYLTAGYPDYYKGPWQIHLENIDEDKDGNEDIDNSGSWKIYNPFREDNRYIANFNQQNMLTPIGIYMENVKPYGAQYIKNGVVQWTQPIICLKNNYPSGTLNKWSGKEIEINHENGYILSPAISAGKKNSDNTFSGVMLGDWSVDPFGVNSFIGKQTGLYGFNHGMVSYAFMEDGTAFIGKSGRGRIYIDGNKSTIQSEGYNSGHGVLIDLDDNIFHMKNGSGGIYLDAYNDLEVDFATKAGKSLFYINNYQNEYYLQSNNFDGSSQGIKIDLSNGEIIGYNLTLQIGGNPPAVVLTSDTKSDYYPFYARSGFIGGFSFDHNSLIGGYKYSWNKGVLATEGDPITLHKEAYHLNGEKEINPATNSYSVFLNPEGMSFGGGSMIIASRTNIKSWIQDQKAETESDHEQEGSEGADDPEPIENGWGLWLSSGRSGIFSDDGKWIIGKNTNNRIQIGTVLQGGNTHIYCGGPEGGKNDTVYEIRLRDKVGYSIARFSRKVIWFQNFEKYKTQLKCGIPAERQHGIYARFA